MPCGNGSQPHNLTYLRATGKKLIGCGCRLNSRTSGVRRHGGLHSVRQPVSGNAVSELLDDGALPLDAAPLELPPSVSPLRWPRSPAPGQSTTSTRGWEPGGGWTISEPPGGERLSNAAVKGGKGTANSGGCKAKAAPSSRLRFCTPPGESGCPCRSLGSGATLDALVPGIVRCSGNCKRIVQLKRRRHRASRKGEGGREERGMGGGGWVEQASCLRGCASAMRARLSTSSAKSVVGGFSASPPPNHWL